MITVWGRKTSSNVQAVLWCLDELGLAFERIDAGHTYGGLDTPAYLEMNPHGRIPTLIDGDNPPLWESGAIIRYLASRYGGEGFWPSDAVARAEIDKWAEWAKLNFAGTFTVNVFWKVVRTAPSKRNWEEIRAAISRVEDELAIADAKLANSEFLAGADLSVADIQFGHSLYRYYDISIERRPLANLERYYQTLTSRPAYASRVMVSYEALRVDD
ncbi:MAG: glutathione S-transferase family protein [Pseudomonadota bacterium]